LAECNTLSVEVTKLRTLANLKATKTRGPIFGRDAYLLFEASRHGAGFGVYAFRPDSLRMAGFGAHRMPTGRLGAHQTSVKAGGLSRIAPARSSIWIPRAFLVLFVTMAAAASVSLGEQQSRRARGASGTARNKVSLDISKINDPNTQDPVGPHSEGEAVIRAAILLDRIRFSPGEITGSYNENLGKAIAAFQSASGLPAIGSMDAPTWAALNGDQTKGQVEPVQNQQNQPSQPQLPNPSATQSAPSPPQNQTSPPPPPTPQQGDTTPQSGQQAKSQQPAGQNPQPGQDQNKSQQPSVPQAQPPITAPPPQGQNNAVAAIISYTIAKRDVAGPFTKLPEVDGRNAGERMMLREARLPRLNYASALELLAEKFHSSPKLLARLNPGKNFKKEGQQIEVPNVTTSTPPPAGSVVADAATRTVTVLDGSGKILAFFPATVGSEHDPLPVGNWQVAEVKWHPKFKYNPKLFWDSEDKHARATLPPGPKGPVGVVWIGLSKEHYGLHGTPNPGSIGRTESHGCVRLTNWDATILANMVHPGTPVILEEGTPSEVKPLSASSR
jgi:lipoprotein-anchoring transpeptidase ErfK/SrfK